VGLLVIPDLAVAALLLVGGIWWTLIVVAWGAWEARFESPGHRSARLAAGPRKEGGPDAWDVVSFVIPIVVSIGLGVDGLAGTRWALYSPPWSFAVPGFDALRVLGGVSLFISLALFTAGAYLTAKYVYNKLPEEQVLLTRGPYRYVRHPIYLAWRLTTLGMILLSLNVLAFSTLIVLFHWGWREEDDALANQFGARYIEYRNRTGAFLPRFRRPR